MRYEKPLVIDMSLRARTASGEPESCYNGTTPAGMGFCQAGTSPSDFLGNQCNNGPDPGVSTPAICVSGLFAGGGGCMSGSAGTSVPDACTSGPQPT